MTRSSPISLLVVALSLACATSPAATPSSTSTPAPTTQTSPPPSAVTATPALNPVGTFDFTAIGPDGSASTGNFVITGTPGNYKGRIERDGVGGADITRITVDGQTMILLTTIPEGEVTLTLNFTGNDFNGKWAVQGAEGAFSGKRR